MAGPDHDDDRPLGHVLSRRELLGLLGATGAVLLPACSSGSDQAATSTSAAGGASTSAATSPATTVAAAVTATVPVPSCVVRPALTEGPYFVDEKLNRSDIRTDPSNGSVKEGVPLLLTFRVAQVTSGNCTALANATVDLWQCDASGVYSDVRDPGFNTSGQKFLRGYQTTDAGGFARFQTIWPGWYQGRAVHIHFKIRTDQGRAFTSQLFFDDGLNDEVFGQAPYSSRGARQLRNASDGIYRDGGSQLLLQPTKEGQAYAATFEIGLQA